MTAPVTGSVSILSGGLIKIVRSSTPGYLQNIEDLKSNVIR